MYIFLNISKVLRYHQAKGSLSKPLNFNNLFFGLIRILPDLNFSTNFPNMLFCTHWEP